MNTKAKGSRRERQTKKMLEAVGYDCTKAGASLGQFDLVCWNQKEIRMIQVKSNRCSKSERESIQEYKNVPSNCSKELWIWKDRVKEPVIEYL